MVRRVRSSRGFSLIELLIALVILGILMALVIPQFFSAKQKAGDKLAQQALTSSMVTVRTLETDTSDFSNVTVASMTTAEPNITFAATAGVTGNVRTVGVGAASNNNKTIPLAALGQDACWYVVMNDDGTKDQFGMKVVPAGTTSCTPALTSDASITWANAFPSH